MKLRLIGLLALVALLTGCSATVPIRPYMFIQNDPEPNAPHAVDASAAEDSVS